MTPESVKAPTEGAPPHRQSAGDAVAYIHDGMHVFANEAYLQLFQYEDLEEVLATPFMDMVEQACRDELKQNLRRCQQGSGKADKEPEQLSMETMALAANKHVFPVRLRMTPTFYEGEHCLQVSISTTAQAELGSKESDAARMPAETRPRAQAEFARSPAQTPPPADALISALEDNSLVLVYQPVMSTAKMVPEFYDIHPQMPGPNGSFHSTEQLMQTATVAPLGLQLDRWVFVHAIALMGDLGKQGIIQQFQLTIGAQTLRDASFSKWFISQLASSGVAAASVVVNIREADAIAWPAEAMALIGSLQNRGIRVCISGYTNREEILSVVTGCKVSFVRFDNGISETESREMSSLSDLKNLVDSLHRQEVKVIAADVTDGETIDGLWIASVDLVQGAWFQKEAQELHVRSFRNDIPILNDRVQKPVSA